MVDQNIIAEGTENSQNAPNQDQVSVRETENEVFELDQSFYDSEEDCDNDDDDQMTEPDSDYADEIEQRRLKRLDIVIYYLIQQYKTDEEREKLVADIG